MLLDQRGKHESKDESRPHQRLRVNSHHRNEEQENEIPRPSSGPPGGTQLETEKARNVFLTRKMADTDTGDEIQTR